MNPGVFVISAGDGKFFSLMWKSGDWFIRIARVLQYDEQLRPNWNRNWSFQRKKTKKLTTYIQINCFAFWPLKMHRYLSSFFCVFCSDCSVAWCLWFEALLKGSRMEDVFVAGETAGCVITKFAPEPRTSEPHDHSEWCGGDHLWSNDSCCYWPSLRGEPRLFLLPFLSPASRRVKYCELLAIGLRPCKMSARRDGTLLSVAALCPQRLAPSKHDFVIS